MKEWPTKSSKHISGIGGNLASCVGLPRLLEAGASSSLLGLMSIYVMDIFTNWKLYDHPIRELIKWGIVGVIMLGVGLMPWLDNFAHIGGIIGGLLSSVIALPNNYRAKKKRAVRIFGIVMLLVIYAAGLTIIYMDVDVNNYCKWCEFLSCLPVGDWAAICSTR